jgi:hypothetical protein
MDQTTTTITAAQIGTAEVDLTAVQDLLDSTRSGTFFHVRGYEAVGGHGEVADYILQHGIKYDSIKAKSEAILQGILDGEETTIHVRHGIWITPADLRAVINASDGEGIRMTFQYDSEVGKVTAEASVPLATVEATFSNRKGKGRIQVEVNYDLHTGDALLTQAVEAALEGIRNPRHVDQGYEKYAKGGYYRAKDGEIKLYIRDCLRVHKVIAHAGEYPFKASLPKSAVRNAVERMTPKGKYRAFKFDGRFEDITMGGTSILVDGIDQSMYFVDPAAYKTARVEAKAEATA